MPYPAQLFSRPRLLRLRGGRDKHAKIVAPLFALSVRHSEHLPRLFVRVRLRQ